MDHASGAKAPLHLWIIGILSLLWNGFGCYDYFMTKTKGAEYVKSMMPGVDAEAVMAYLNGIPAWGTALWALGVWGGLLGSALLLARHRWAVPALGISMLGAVLGLGYQLMNPPAIPAMHEGINAVMPYIIILVAIGLFIYARAMKTKGVLN